MKVVHISKAVSKTGPHCNQTVQTQDESKTPGRMSMSERTGHPHHKCQIRARYLIDGIPFCLHHAGKKVLNHLVEIS